MQIKISEQELKQKIKEGLDNKALASYFKCSPRTINYRKAKYGLSQKQQLTDSEKSNIAFLYNAGYSIRDISKKVNRSESSVSRYLVDSGIRQIKKAEVKDKKCPYCSYEAANWKSIRGHTSNCLYNTHSYFISLRIGPILLSDLKDKNFIQIKEKYPLNTNELAGLSTVLRKRGFSTKVSWDKKTAKQAVNNWYEETLRIPTTRDTYNSTLLPSDNWVKKEFGTWNTFIEYCGFTPPDNNWGTTVKHCSGLVLRSNFEHYFFENFIYNKLSFVYELPYPGNTNRISDFYLPDYDLFIELAGGLRPEVIQEKINFCKENKLNLLVLYPKQVYKKDFDLLGLIKN